MIRVHGDFASIQSVETSMWKPTHAPLDYPEEFAKFVDSINSGWRNMKTYEPFELYKRQAQIWIEEKDDILNYFDIESQEDYVIQEYFRNQDNTLYFANKYGFIKEGDAIGGKIDYEAWEAQQLLLFLLDCWYNMMIGKARQIGFTTTMGLAAIKRINFNYSYFVKFITHTKDKGEEIFRDKIRWGFGQIEPWIREEVYNDSHNQLSLQAKGKKGETVGSYSRVEVSTPAIDAINGGSPNLVLIDEIGLFEIFGQMMREGRPALFFFNPVTQRMEMKRQFVSWGTGGEMDKGGAAFEVEFKAALNAWRERNFKYGVIPLFFDAFARNGMTMEIYESEKKVYYSKTGTELEKAKVQFHQHFPLSIDDMFLRNAKTILPISECNRHLVKIWNLKEEDKPQYGYFEPIYDRSSPTQDGELPFRLLGATFVPTSGPTDERTSACIFRHPPYDEQWKYRWYQGTDPINSETGHSKMSASVWDNYTNSLAAVVFHRVKNFKESYLQCVLLSLYYDQTKQGGIPELVESNIGDMYVDFREKIGLGRNIVPNAALPVFLQTPSSKWWGIRNSTATAGRIANKTIEMIDSFAENIFIPWFFEQCKTFVEKDLKSQNQQRQTRYQAADLRYDFDDVIFSSTFANINAQCHAKFEPTKTEKGEQKRRYTQYVQNAQTGFRLRLAEVDERGKVIRYLGGDRGL